MQKNRVFGLDIMRCIAILAVVYLHALSFFDVKFDNYWVRLTLIDGVGLFFVLSGFLIGGILIKTLQREQPIGKTLWKFWINRWWRTLPAYLVVLAVIVVGGYLKGGHPLFLRYLLFIQNIKTGELPWFGESWSLSVEEWFYLLTPPLIFFAVRKLPLSKAVPAIAIFIIAVVNMIRIYKVQHYGICTYSQWTFELMMTVPTRLDSLMYGVLGAYVKHFEFPVWKNRKNALFASGIAILAVNNILHVTLGIGFYSFYCEPSMFPIGGLLLLPKFDSIKEGKGRIARVITFISLISYSIYLVHGSIFFSFISPLISDSAIIHLLVYLLWAFGAAYLLYSTVERWGMRQRDKINTKGMQKRAADAAVV